MKRFAAGLVSLWLGIASVQADLVVVQKIEGSGQTGEQTTKIKEDKARTDIGTGLSVIIDRKTGEQITLAHTPRGYITVSPERAQAMADRMKSAAGTTELPKLVPAGKKEKIGEYNCDIYTVDLGKVKITYWLAPEYPNYQAILTQMDILEGNPLSTAAAGLAPLSKDFPGMKIKMQIEKDGQKVTVTLISAKEEAVDPAIFKIPSGYKEMPPGK